MLKQEAQPTPLTASTQVKFLSEFSETFSLALYYHVHAAPMANSLSLGLEVNYSRGCLSLWDEIKPIFEKVVYLHHISCSWWSIIAADVWEGRIHSPPPAPCGSHRLPHWALHILMRLLSSVLLWLSALHCYDGQLNQPLYIWSKENNGINVIAKWGS